MKKYLYLFISLIGLLIFIGLVIMMCLIKADYVKYFLLFGGYLSVVLFAYGYLKYLKLIGKR